MAVCDIGAFEFGAVFPTTTLPPCLPAPTFSSVRCRLQALSNDVLAAVPAGELQDRLQGALTAATGKVDEAEVAFGEGKKRRLKAKLGGAKKSVKKFGKTVRSRKADALPTELRVDFDTRAEELKDSLQELRQTPAS